MKMFRRIALLAAFSLCLAPSLFSRPSSGIAVTEQGEVLFVHRTRRVAKLERDGMLNHVHKSTGGHWLCLDPQGSFSNRRGLRTRHLRNAAPLYWNADSVADFGRCTVGCNFDAKLFAVASAKASLANGTGLIGRFGRSARND